MSQHLPALPALFVYALWIGLVLYLTVTAFRAKRDVKPHLGQSFMLMFALIAAFALPQNRLFGFVNFTPGPAVAAAGLLIACVGSLFFIAARQTLGKNWSQTVAEKVEPELITWGPYKYVRHPMYASGLLTCFGSAMAAGGGFVFMLILLTPIFLWRVYAEDELLSRRFPAEFPDYKKRTRALIPFIW